MHTMKYADGERTLVAPARPGAWTALVWALTAGIIALVPPMTAAEDAGDLAVADSLSRAFRKAASAVKPSVVSISSVEILEPRRLGRQGLRRPLPDDENLREFFGDDFMDRFFRGMPGIPRDGLRRQGLGSGLIVSPEGHIVTNNHVVENADELTVTLADDTEFEAKVVGRDEKTDLAVIKIEAKDLPAAVLGDSDGLEVGDWVLAVGSPFGLSQSITAGIVSAKGRMNLGIVEYEDFIQTDAAVNPGNSGGPLVNLRGEVIGLNTAIFSRSGGNMGVGFAIPANIAKEVMNAIIKEGKVTRGYLGVGIQDLTPELAAAMDFTGSGVLVRQVMPGTPAEKADLRDRDIIVRLDGKEMKDSFGLRRAVAAVAPGTEVKLTVIRDGKELEATITIGEMEDEESAALPPVPPP